MGTWDETDEMLSRHETGGMRFEIRGYESSADEFTVHRNGREVLRYVNTAGFSSAHVGWDVGGDPHPVVVAYAMVALMERFMMSEEAAEG